MHSYSIQSICIQQEYTYPLRSYHVLKRMVHIHNERCVIYKSSNGIKVLVIPAEMFLHNMSFQSGKESDHFFVENDECTSSYQNRILEVSSDDTMLHKQIMNNHQYLVNDYAKRQYSIEHSYYPYC